METGDDGLVARRVFQLTRCSETRQATCTRSIRAGRREKGTGESNWFGEIERLVEQ